MSEQQIYMTAAAKRFKELDQIAFNFGYAQNEMMISSLPPEEHAYVMSMAHLYAMYRLGKITKQCCVTIKKKKIKEVTQIHNAMLYARHMHKRWIECTKIYYREYKGLTDLIKNSDPAALRKALELLDLLSNSYIYTRMYQSADTANMQEIVFEDIIDDVIEGNYDDAKRRDLKRLIATVFEAFEEDELPAFLQDMTETEMREISESLPEKSEYVTEEVIRELMPRVS